MPAQLQGLLTRCGVEASLGMVRCELSVLFMDIAGVTEMCQTRDAKDTLELLSTVHNESSAAIDRYQGMLLEFIGNE